MLESSRLCIILQLCSAPWSLMNLDCYPLCQRMLLIPAAAVPCCSCRSSVPAAHLAPSSRPFKHPARRSVMPHLHARVAAHTVHSTMGKVNEKEHLPGLHPSLNCWCLTLHYLDTYDIEIHPIPY